MQAEEEQMPVAITADAAPLLPQFRAALDFAATQAEHILTRHPNYAPMYTVQGKWGREPERWTHWCEGFFPGILWLLHTHFNDEKWAEAARRLSRPLEP